MDGALRCTGNFFVLLVRAQGGGGGGGGGERLKAEGNNWRGHGLLHQSQLRPGPTEDHKSQQISGQTVDATVIDDDDVMLTQSQELDFTSS